MTGEELFLNELNFHILQGISKKDLADLINERIKQLTTPVVVGQSEQLHSCKYVKRIGESCTLNNNCKYPKCE